MFMEDKGLTTSLSSTGGQQKKVEGMPFGCPRLCGETSRSLTSYSTGPSRQLEAFSDVSKCCCTAAPPPGLAGHDWWGGNICSNEKPRLKCDGQMAPQGIEQPKTLGLCWEDGLPADPRAERV